MTYQEMMEKAKLFNEMLEIQAKKPRLIAECQQKINRLKNEIQGMESDNAQQVMNKLNPKKFFFKKPETVDISELILKMEIEIRKEEKRIEALENVKTKDLVDISAVIQECAAILNKQTSVFENMEDEIIKAREKYHHLLDHYNKEMKYHNQFAHTVRNTIDKVNKEGFIPQYMGDVPRSITVGSGIEIKDLSQKIVNGHRGNIRDLAISPKSVNF